MSYIAVALSGGVDSSTSAALLKQAGHEIFGVTMLLCDNAKAGVSIDFAERVCKQLGIKHHVFDFRPQFQDNVIDYFKGSYEKGFTPNPCAKCNQKIKFGALFDAATKMGADALATGHYARMINDKSSGFGLYTGTDKNKDQSYFLFGIEKRLLGSIYFPLGDKCKPDVRVLAAEFGLCTADKKESQDICFVSDGDYKSVLSCGSNIGDIVDIDGKVLGKHDGLWNYTIGQRKGLKISGSRPLFVIGMDPENNRVIVGEREALEYTRFFVTKVNWLVDFDCLPEKVSVKTRYAQSPVPAQIKLAQNSNDVWVELLSPTFALSPGQCAVFYCGERVLGGGWICGREYVDVP